MIALPRAVADILETLHKNGYRAYAVGGCVRDSLLGRTPHDWDVASDAAAETVKGLFPRTIDTGLRHGTVTVLCPAMAVEVTTFRRDGDYSDRRRPDSVSFTDSLREDAARRDFTVNAMYYNESEGLVDCFGGQNDLASCLIRAVGNPFTRFDEDALRILRAGRFAAELGFAVEAETRQAMEGQKRLLRHISRERIGAELSRALLGDVARGFGLFLETGCLYEIDERLSAVTADKLAACAHLPALLPLRWACVLMGANEPEQILRGLRADNHTLRQVRLLLEHVADPLGSDYAMRRFAADWGIDVLGGLIQLRLTYGGGTPAEQLGRKETEWERAHQSEAQRLERLIREGGFLTKKEFQINGADLLQMGLKEGRAVGALLDQLFDKVLRGSLPNRHERLLEEAQRRINER